MKNVQAIITTATRGARVFKGEERHASLRAESYMRRLHHNGQVFLFDVLPDGCGVECAMRVQGYLAGIEAELMGDSLYNQFHGIADAPPSRSKV